MWVLLRFPLQQWTTLLVASPRITESDSDTGDHLAITWRAGAGDGSAQRTFYQQRCMAKCSRC